MHKVSRKTTLLIRMSIFFLCIGSKIIRPMDDQQEAKEAREFCDSLGLQDSIETSRLVTNFLNTKEFVKKIDKKSLKKDETEFCIYLINEIKGFREAKIECSKVLQETTLELKKRQKRMLWGLGCSVCTTVTAVFTAIALAISLAVNCS